MSMSSSMESLDLAGDSDSEDEDEIRRKKRFSLKRLIRLLHINEPVFHVMALLGKK